MHKLTTALLGGAALSILGIAPGVAGNPPGPHVQALHEGRLVRKGGGWHRCHPHVSCYTYTLGVSSSVPASGFRKKVKLVNTFFKWCSNGTCFTEPKQWVKVPRKSEYGKVNAASVTTRTSGGERTFVYYGDAYKLTDKSGLGKTDTFVSSLKAEWERAGFKYKAMLNLDVSVTIGTE